MGTSLGVVGHDGAHLVEALEDRALVGLRAVPLRAGTEHAEVPLRGRRRRAAAAERSAGGRRGALRLGRAEPAHARQRRPARRVRGAGIAEPDRRCKSAIVCPLFFDDAFIGCLALYHTTPNCYAEDHRRLLERVAEQAGAVIHNSIVFEQTQEDSLTDPLTGLPNRRSMFVHLSRELSRAERLKSEVALIVMDIDEFKTINDTYGHHVGDPALREVAHALQQRAAALRPLRPLRRRRIHRRARRLLARGRRSQAARAAGAARPDRARGAARQAPRAWRSARAPRSSRTTARPTRRCSPKPISACIATRRCGAETFPRRVRRRRRNSSRRSSSNRHLPAKRPFAFPKRPDRAGRSKDRPLPVGISSGTV